jgi:hypothetical protein
LPSTPLLVIHPLLIIVSAAKNLLLLLHSLLPFPLCNAGQHFRGATHLISLMRAMAAEAAIKVQQN